MRPGGMVIWLDDVAESRRGAARPPGGLRRGAAPTAGGLRRGGSAVAPPGAPLFVSFTRGACVSRGSMTG